MNRNGLDMNALMEAAPRHFIPRSGEGASGGNTSKEIKMITNRVHARGEEASGKSAEPCVGHVTAGLTKSYKAIFFFFCIFVFARAARVLYLNF